MEPTHLPKPIPKPKPNTSFNPHPKPKVEPRPKTKHPSRTLSPVPEEEEKPAGETKVKEEKEKTDTKPVLDPDSDMSDDEAFPLELDVHGLKAKVYLNCADVDIIPARYLEKAERSPILKRTPWIFRTAQDGRDVNLTKWSKVDIRFRGVFKTLKNAPPFTKGLFENNNGQMASSAKIDFEEAVKAQAQVVYALMDEILNLLEIHREMESFREFFHLRPRLISCKPEYWTGYRVKHRDSPWTAGSIALDFSPDRGICRTVVPILTTTERHNKPLKPTLEGGFKLLLAQFLLNIYRLSPPGDKLPDQETFLIVLHGSRLHILRGVFPGQKTSKLWCGRHNPGPDPDSQSTHNLVANMSDRFYSKMNLERFLEQVEWNQLSNPENEVCPRVFQILGSREYDLWMKWEFAAALKMLSGLMYYLMSGQARCGILQHVFEQFPYDEGIELESEEEGKEVDKKMALEQKHVEEQEQKLKEKEKKKRDDDQAKATEREAMRTSVKDRIEGLAGGFRQPWWDWVWDDKDKDGCAKDDADIILRGP
ncbi:hypothetical protein BJX99DRAFT_259569 [Aspergillus californicus]